MTRPPRSGVFVVVALALLSCGGCEPADSPSRSAGPASGGAPEVIPWAALQISGTSGVGRAWRFPLRNPLEIPVHLARPNVDGCGPCLSARWGGAPGGPDGGVRLAPGEGADLVLEYTGHRVPDTTRYMLAFEFSERRAPPVHTPVLLRLDRDIPFRPEELSVRSVAGSLDPVRFDWSGKEGWTVRGMELAGRPSIGSVLFRAHDADKRDALVVFPLEPWSTFQVGTLTVGTTGARDHRAVPWRCIGRAPFLVRFLRSMNGASLVIESRVDTPIAATMREVKL